MAILAHALPNCACCSARMRSSSNVHSPFLMEGSKWLCHLQKIFVLPGVSIGPDYMCLVSCYLGQDLPLPTLLPNPPWQLLSYQ